MNRMNFNSPYAAVDFDSKSLLSFADGKRGDVCIFPAQTI